MKPLQSLKRIYLRPRVPALTAVLVAAFACATVKPAPLEGAKAFEVDRFMGTWHEVARLPLAFERDCVAASFTYKRVKRDEIAIHNMCWYKSLNGPMRRADATAYLRDLRDPTQLLIHFTGPFSGPYHIAFVDPEYHFALVGSPDRQRLWVLSRTYTPSPEQVEALLREAERLGFDTKDLIYTKELREDDRL